MKSVNLDKLNRGKIREWLEDGDGHGVYPIDAYVEMGFEADYVARYYEKHVSDTSDPKKTIFAPDGSIKKELRGVHNLTILRAFARGIEADTRLAETMFGRGRMARLYGQAALTRLKALGFFGGTDK